MKRERIWYRDDITSAQRVALRALRDVGGRAAAGLMLGVRLGTWRALHRLGLVRTDRGDVIEPGEVVELTASGRESAADGG